MAVQSREARKNRRIQRIRMLLLVAVIATVAGVTALLIRGGSEGREERPSGETTDPTALEAAGDMVTVGEGFERTVSEGDRSLFTVRGETYSVDQENRVHLEGVGITIYGDEGSGYELEAPEATFDLDRRQGRLTGGVVMTGADGLRMETGELQVVQRGRQVRSSGRVYLRFGERMHARADRMRLLLRARRYHLIGHARIESLEGAERPFDLTARRLTLDRTRHLVEAEEGPVRLHHLDDWLAADHLTVFLDESEQRIQYLRSRSWLVAELRSDEALGAVGDGVRPERPDRPPDADADAGPTAFAASGGAGGGDSGAGDPGRLRIHAETLEMEMTPDGRHPADLHLEGGPGGRTTVRSFGAGGGPVYRLEAPRIDGLFEEGRPATFEAAERVRVEVVDDPALVERAVEAELASWWAAVSGDRQAGSGPGAGDESEGLERWGEGRRAEAAFDATGALATVTLIDDVEIVDGETRARGDRGVFRASDDAAEVTGEPARVVTPRTAMEAPTVTYTRADGILHGSGGVRARLERDGDGGGPASALDGTPLGEGEGPVWVEAEQGFFRDRPRSFLFAGSVRAWKGEDLLTGSRLRGEEAEGTLTASGDVRTLWIPEPADPEGDPRPEDSPIEVTADEMTYRRGRSVLVYTGDVVAEQERRMLACREMEMHLRSADGADEARKEGTGRLERLICTGAVRMSEPAAGPDEGGRTLRGHRAVYDPAARTIDVVAGPGGRVVMEDPDGNVIEGPRMIYEIDRERVRMLPLEEADGEATPDPGEGESQGETEDQTGDESGGGP